MLGSGLFVPLIEPKITYILPPLNGWKLPNKFDSSFVKAMIPGIKQIYYDYLLDNGAFTNPFLDIEQLKQQYLDERAKHATNTPTR